MTMNTLRYIFFCAAFLALASCGGKKEAMNPEAVTEAFCRAVAAGDFDMARSLCDTVSMNDYLENCRMAMNSLQKEDSCAFAIATGILSGAEFEVMNVEKDGDGRTVRYRLAAEGCAKTRNATLKKEEGEWRVTSISDAI